LVISWGVKVIPVVRTSKTRSYSTWTITRNKVEGGTVALLAIHMSCNFIKQYYGLLFSLDTCQSWMSSFVFINTWRGVGSSWRVFSKKVQFCPITWFWGLALAERVCTSPAKGGNYPMCLGNNWLAIVWHNTQCGAIGTYKHQCTPLFLCNPHSYVFCYVHCCADFLSVFSAVPITLIYGALSCTVIFVPTLNTFKATYIFCFGGLAMQTHWVPVVFTYRNAQHLTHISLAGSLMPSKIPPPFLILFLISFSFLDMHSQVRVIGTKRICHCH
jgi:hypothetical protein